MCFSDHLVRLLHIACFLVTSEIHGDSTVGDGARSGGMCGKCHGVHVDSFCARQSVLESHSVAFRQSNNHVTTCGIQREMDSLWKDVQRRMLRAMCSAFQEAFCDWCQASTFHLQLIALLVHCLRQFGTGAPFSSERQMQFGKSLHADGSLLTVPSVQFAVKRKLAQSF